MIKYLFKKISTNGLNECLFICQLNFKKIKLILLCFLYFFKIKKNNIKSRTKLSQIDELVAM